MKPRHLAFNGLRSYVEAQSIDFTGKQFIAVLGDTGAGKSTVLDAICYALYNRCSWSSGTVTELIAHGGDGTLSVAFTFEASAQTWLVERSTSSTSAAAVHKLTSVDTGTVVATGRDAVNAHIRRILRLTYDTFLRSVVLPQGRFQELLRMGDTERSKTLKSLLGLNELSTVREHAITLHARLAPRLADYRERRALFLPDPTATINEAGQRHANAAHRLDQLQTAQSAITAAQKTAAQTRTLHRQLCEARDRLTESLPDEVDSRYQAILLAAADIAQRREPLEIGRREAGGDQERRQAQLDAAAEAGTGVADTATALNTLKNLAEQVPALDALAERVERDRIAVSASNALLEAARTRVGDRRIALGLALSALDTATGGLTAAEQAHQGVAHALSRYRDAGGLLKSARQHRTAAQLEHEALKAQAQVASARAREAEGVLVVAEGEDAAAHRLHAVAVAGQGCQPGDDCPLCHQRLPGDFVAPDDTAAKTAGAAVRRARKAVTEAAKQEATAAERVKISEQKTLVAAEEAVTKAGAELEVASFELHAVLGDGDVSAADNELRQPFVEAVEAATLLRDGAEVEHREAYDAHTRATAELPVLEDAQGKRVVALRELEAEHDGTIVALNRKAKSIPRAYRPAHGLPLEEIIELRQRAERRTIELEVLSTQTANLAGIIKQLAAALRQLDDESATHVTRPAGQLRSELDAVAIRGADTEKLLNTSECHPGRPVGADLADEISWSTQLFEHASTLAAACASQASQAQTAAGNADQQAQRARHECHADNDEHLEQLIRAASTAEHNANRDLARATAQQPIVTDLERRISGATPIVAALADLSALLTDGKFIANAVRRRQTALLQAASNTLLTISGGSFGFGENFQIVDTETGRGRDVKTLSGGETFQASLALALAVVELASRTAGRVDSLFLDEGFGSLDAGVLQDALNALAAHSADGRMVTIISHMRSIAEITDHVLVVERTFTGSQCHWADPDERDRIVNDDLNRGLLE